MAACERWVLKSDGKPITCTQASSHVLEDLTIENSQFGSISYSGVIDLRDSPAFLEAVRFGPLVVEVDSTFSNGVLNRPATVSFFNVPSCSSSNDTPQRLQDAIVSQGAEFLSFDSQSRVYKFNVSHFSRYGLLSDDEDDEDNTAAKPAATTKTTGHYGLDESDESEDSDDMFEDGDGSEEDAADGDSNGDVSTEQEPSDSDESEESLVEDLAMEVEFAEPPQAFPGSQSIAKDQAQPASLPKRRTVVVRAPPAQFEPITRTPGPGTATADIVDASLFLGRSARVSWGPGGLLARPHCSAGKPHVVLGHIVTAPHLKGQLTNETEFLNELLGQYQASPDAMVRASQVPGWQITSPAAAIAAAQAIAQLDKPTAGATLDPNNEAHRDHAARHFALALVDVLWGTLGQPPATLAAALAPTPAPGPAEPVAVDTLLGGAGPGLQRRRREALCAWLARYAALTEYTPHTTPAGPARPGARRDDNETEMLEQVMARLCVNDVTGACELAMAAKV